MARFPLYLARQVQSLVLPKSNRTKLEDDYETSDSEDQETDQRHDPCHVHQPLCRNDCGTQKANHCKE